MESPSSEAAGWACSLSLRYPYDCAESMKSQSGPIKYHFLKSSFPFSSGICENTIINIVIPKMIEAPLKKTFASHFESLNFIGSFNLARPLIKLGKTKKIMPKGKIAVA